MNENDINHILRGDAQLREAIRQHEQQLPPMPADLNDRLMECLMQQDKRPRHRHLWPYTAIAVVAAGIALLLILHHANKYDPLEGPLLGEVNYKFATQSSQIAKSDETGILSSAEVASPQNEKVNAHPPSKVPSSLHQQEQEPAAPSTLPETTELSIYEFDLAEEERRFDMEMMAAQMEGTLQADYENMKKEIRERGNRMTQHVEIVLSNNAY